jgi:hypothetical protein
MNDTKKIKTTELITKGYLWVNIPVIAIFIIVWLGLFIMLDLNYLISVFIGTIAGWYYWEFAIRKWIKWEIKNDVEKERILKIGRMTLLLSKKSTIENAISNDKT